ncbi:hypothetical protein Anapl_05692 [Anas platyrhynchos]|uniref:Uncharacterized protein n=1 Tax=Anas platyrhynchos TaxID=8839 RepID=R0LQT5_ANAPL|nr:hypothetical protein Anapl_05692 [Anas platyrhynchos]
MTLPYKDSHASRHIKTHLESFINHSSSEGNRELNGSLSYGISTLVVGNNPGVKHRAVSPVTLPVSTEHGSLILSESPITHRALNYSYYAAIRCTILFFDTLPAFVCLHSSESGRTGLPHAPRMAVKLGLGGGQVQLAVALLQAQSLRLGHPAWLPTLGAAGTRSCHLKALTVGDWQQNCSGRKHEKRHRKARAVGTARAPCLRYPFYRGRQTKGLTADEKPPPAFLAATGDLASWRGKLSEAEMSAFGSARCCWEHPESERQRGCQRPRAPQEQAGSTPEAAGQAPQPTYSINAFCWPISYLSESKLPAAVRVFEQTAKYSLCVTLLASVAYSGNKPVYTVTIQPNSSRVNEEAF